MTRTNFPKQMKKASRKQPKQRAKSVRRAARINRNDLKKLNRRYR